jgi:hypothetical protein
MEFNIKKYYKSKSDVNPSDLFKEKKINIKINFHKILI